MRHFACFIKALPGECADVSISLPAEAHSMISGIVQDSDGRTVQNALVLLLRTETEELLAYTTTSEQGRFWFGPLEPGTLYRIQVQTCDTTQRTIEFTL